LGRHVLVLHQTLRAQYVTATSRHAQQETALAGLAHLILWLGWLRSGECFGLRWCDFSVVEPRNGPVHDLPIGLGAVTLRLNPETKSDRSKTADVVIAYQTFSGYSIGSWFHWARRAWHVSLDTSTDFRYVFRRPDGVRWDSHYFRHTFLYPSLVQQSVAGDVFLKAFDDAPGNSIPEKFYSLHCYRRGARTHVSRAKAPIHGAKKASDVQVYEHARWRRKRANEKIDVVYRDWTLRDRIKLTLYFQ
jgi:hypothetical protein